MLAAVMFVKLVCVFNSCVDVVNLTNIADNAELINRCNAHQEYDRPYTNVSKRGEQDVTEEVSVQSNAGMLK